MDRDTETGRISFFAYLFSSHIARRTSATLLAVFLQLPAFFSSCIPQKEADSVLTKAQIYIHWSEIPTPEALDFFFFNTDGPMRLDAYQQVTGLDRALFTYTLCGSGDRQLVALSGEPGNVYAWSDIQTYGSLGKLHFSLEGENPERPRLVGETFLEEGRSRQALLTLHPMLCAIQVRSVSCDFSGHPYAGIPFNNNKLYLLNAGVECLPLGEGDGPVSWMNMGQLDSAAVLDLPYPEMLLQEGCGPIGVQRIYPDKVFFCYANPATEDQLGSPVTRLVLEGSIGGTSCYYPVNLPRMLPGSSYQLDLTLTRMGSPSPDIPVESGTVLVQTDILPWNCFNPETLSF